MENIIMLILGVFISVVGIVNIKGNISTIHSYNRQNATWQGSVTWVEKKEKQQFRSALELLKLIESALDEEEGENHEK